MVLGVGAISVKVAIVGCGGIARRHIHGFQQVPDAEFVAMCDVQEGRARACAAEYGGRAYTSVVDALETEAPDLVDVCTREMDRDVPVIQSVERGFTTLAEKPLFAARGPYTVMPHDVPVARRMLDASDAGGGELLMASNYRFGEYAQGLKAMIDAGELNELQYVHASTRLACWSHVIDLLRWFCGDIVDVAAALGGPEEARTRTSSPPALSRSTAEPALSHHSMGLRALEVDAAFVLAAERRAWVNPIEEFEV